MPNLWRILLTLLLIFPFSSAQETHSHGAPEKLRNDLRGGRQHLYNYAKNVLTQTIGSNTVKVCRAGVCSDTIPF
jgi:hypothetical protein